MSMDSRAIPNAVTTVAEPTADGDTVSRRTVVPSRSLTEGAHRIVARSEDAVCPGGRPVRPGRLHRSVSDWDESTR
jgi:hypothetical protein